MRAAAHLRPAHLAALAGTVASVSAADPVAAFLQQITTRRKKSRAVAQGAWKRGFRLGLWRHLGGGDCLCDRSERAETCRCN